MARKQQPRFIILQQKKLVVNNLFGNSLDFPKTRDPSAVSYVEALLYYTDILGKGKWFCVAMAFSHETGLALLLFFPISANI